ncbi:hypothetical protein QUF61_04490 [Candidatus Venteria ishoeyi]|uniref:hypothetical protein n=1 Tax=Candidatus Venteria ishoeyi TaxID=1899563 RepID=UPI0025A5ADC9|nr:hypothetical protein [Candidatus Venteria ishoeyi]MDM8545734.1 hypothetical protein [Candidatus Venteria ishoeyi]
MKPDTRTTMYDIISQVRGAFPFGAPETQLCADVCSGCSKKLLEFLETEIEDWEARLDAGDIPNFGDISRMVKISRKVQRVLINNNLIPPEQTNTQ